MVVVMDGDLSRGIMLSNVENLRRRIPAPVCQTHPSLPLSDVKMKTGGFLCHVRAFKGKPVIEQNADTGVFSLGDFYGSFIK
jgi:hypothetical protein